MIFRRSLAFLAGTFAAAALSASAQAGSVTLRPDIRVAGPAITLADVFTDAGPAGGRAVAPAPSPGRSANLSARFLSAAAAAAGLSWTPPEGVAQIVVVGAREAGPARLSPSSGVRGDDPNAGAAPVIHRGDLVTLVYLAPGLQLTTRAKSLGEAGLGEGLRVVNLQSNKIVDARATGPGEASASSF